jgi:hypothetical protein
MPPERIVAHLSQVRTTQPVAALAAANQHPAALSEVFLQALERGLRHPAADFAHHGMLFNYAAYFLAKWRDQRAYPLFLRWFSLPGEDALELGGDTLAQDGARLLAAVCPSDVQGLKDLMRNRDAQPVCRGQAIIALAVLAAWGSQPLPEVESHLAFLVRDGLERTPGQVWNDLARACHGLEIVSLFPELRRAVQEGLIAAEVCSAETLDQLEAAPRGQVRQVFAQRFQPIGDVAQETRWWAGFQAAAGSGQNAGSQPYVAPPKVGRNDACPCGSGKKFKKCCGK